VFQCTVLWDLNALLKYFPKLPQNLGFHLNTVLSVAAMKEFECCNEPNSDSISNPTRTERTRELLRAPSKIAGAPSKQWMGNYVLLRRLFPKDLSFEKLSEDYFSGKLPEDTSSGRRRWTFGRSVFRKFPEKGSSGILPSSSGRRLLRKFFFLFF